MAKPHIFIDKSGLVWRIRRHTLPKKRGVYKFFIAESADGKNELRENTLQGTVETLKENFGVFEK